MDSRGGDQGLGGSSPGLSGNIGGGSPGFSGRVARSASVVSLLPASEQRTRRVILDFSNVVSLVEVRTGYRKLLLDVGAHSGTLVACPRLRARPEMPRTCVLSRCRDGGIDVAAAGGRCCNAHDGLS